MITTDFHRSRVFLLDVKESKQARTDFTLKFESEIQKETGLKGCYEGKD